MYSMGTTILALPSAFSDVGIIPGFFLMFVAAIFNVFACTLIIEVCEMTQQFSYETLAKHLSSSGF